MDGSGFTFVDILVVLILLGSAAYATYRGFIGETLGIFAWVAAIFATMYFGYIAVNLIEPHLSPPWLGAVLGYLAVFVIVLVPLEFLSHRISQTVQHSPVSGLDRALGFFFGLVRGAIVIGLLYFAYSSIEHMGIIVFAFGLGGPLANFAGLLHMVMHSLTKSAIFFSVGHIAQIKGTQKIADIRGLTETHPVLGWGLVMGVIAIAGLPPLGIFMSEFLIVSSTFARDPLLAIPLVLGILIAFGALLLRLNGLAFGEPVGSRDPAKASYVPMLVHFALVLVAGIYLPPTLVIWFQHIAGVLG